MNEGNNLLFLGTGGSMGIPVIGCSCDVCGSENPFNKRLRPSALLTMNGKQYLIDCGPDFRFQALTHNITHLDGVFLTHTHHDHCIGIDELRVFTFRRGYNLPCLMSEETDAELRMRFAYIFSTDNLETKYTTNFEPLLLKGKEGVVDLDGMKVRYCSYIQGGMKVNGLRFGNLAFLTDVKEFDDSIFEFLQGVDLLVLNALRYTPSPLHLTVDEAIEFSKRSGVKNAWFTHIAHELEHEATNAYLPANIRLAYDGLKISFNAEKV